ncbi:MAG TPA: NAD(P)H-binding protein [Terriglobales bacterium]|nr:NAD(P)H-binding protein [Terriglobales bacterium]
MYVITGATGHTGHIIAKTLLARGQKVRAIGRNAEHLKPLVGLGADPFIADLADRELTAKAFAGARAVYAMIPPDFTSQSYRARQDSISDALAAALSAAKVPYAVSLSSVGADKPDKTGPVVGLHNLEQKLNKISGLSVLHLRPGYFMENTLGQAGAIHAGGMTAGPFPADLKIPMIATRDIAAVAAEELLKLDFAHKQIRELHGQRDLDMNEVTAILGKAVGRPEIRYHQLPDEQFRAALMSFGMSADYANLILEMAAAMVSGHMRMLEPRSVKNTTPTSYETFVADTFLPAFQAQGKAA